MKPKKNRIEGSVLATLLFPVLALHVFCQTPQKDRFIKVFFPDGRSVVVELAVTEEERSRGLMYREKILLDQGMLFIFERPERYTFWMKNTLIPLDLLWLGQDKRLIHIERQVPPCREEPCPTYGPNEPALYVLELQSGGAEAFNLKLGDHLEFVVPDWVDSALSSR